LADAGELPALAKLRANGVQVELYGGAAADPSLYWNELFGERELVDSGGVLDALEASSKRVILVHVPGVDGSDHAHGVLAGADRGRAFIGDSTGVVESLATLGRGAAPWPYRSAARDLAQLVDGVEVGGSSPWLEARAGGADDRRGVFKVYRLDETAYYLTPVYRRTAALPAPINQSAAADAGPASDALYVADDPSPVAASSRTREYLGLHAAELSRDRAEAARRLMAGGWDVMLLFETLPAVAYAADADRAPGASAPASSDMTDVYAQVDAQLARLVATAGTGTLVFVIGREAQAGESEAALGRAKTGFLLAATGDGTAVGVQAELTQVARTLLEASGLPTGPATDATVIPAVVARYRRPSAAGRDARASLARRGVGELAASPATLEKLGALAATAAIPADTDAVVQPDD
jgi:hypothetical protein